jgi:hypothetical protein
MMIRRKNRVVTGVLALLFLGLGLFWLSRWKGEKSGSSAGAIREEEVSGAPGASQDSDSEPAASRTRRRDSPNTMTLKRIGGGQPEELWDGDRLVFRATWIRTWGQLPDGSWVIAAMTGNKQGEGGSDPTIGPDGKIDLNYSPTELWLVKKGEEARNITPAGMDAGRALPSPDGRKVAFSGCYRDPEGRELVIHSIYVLDLATMSVTALTNGNERGLKGDYDPDPKYWSDDGKSLEIQEHYGETGMNHQSRTVDVR